MEEEPRRVREREEEIREGERGRGEGKRREVERERKREMEQGGRNEKEQAKIFGLRAVSDQSKSDQLSSRSEKFVCICYPPVTES